jgi:nitroreductase
MAATQRQYVTGGCFMNFIDVLKRRRAVRNYTQATLERPEVETLINAAIEAPSAMNLQPWAFAVVLGREQIDGYAKRAKDWLLANLSQLSDPAQRRLEQRILEDPDFTLFYHAPALVMVLAKSSEPQADEDCCLATENLMLAARDRDLGTCWIGFSRPWLNLPETKAELGIPEQYQVVAPIVLGRPVAWPESHGRKPAEIHWITPVRAEQLPLVTAG